MCKKASMKALVCHVRVSWDVQAMQQREAEMDAMAAKKMEELAAQLRALRKQKEESDEQAEKAGLGYPEGTGSLPNVVTSGVMVVDVHSVY